MNFTRPSQLPTPPEADTDFLSGGYHTMDPMSSRAADPDVNPHPLVGAPFRRVSTLAYHTTPLRDPRERPSVRQSRWLIVVIPPASLAQGHGPLGHTLCSGPSQRLSQGIVMPLQPTMHGQLNAIAREFNFPSHVGLCLYLHVTEHGITMTPRISDEIWPAVWGHLFEARSPASLSQVPICGRIEFDIDQRKARWLDSWLTSDRRHAADVPVSVPPSLSHWREDSKNSFFDERGDERPEVLSALRTDSQIRHIPKKLSLVDKLETLSMTSSVANAIVGSSALHPLSTSLPTVLQEEEPKTAKIDLEKRVESWRARSSVAPTPIATGQISVGPIHIPNNIQLNDVDILAATDGVDGIDPNGFAWSPSSMGPPDYQPPASAVSRSHVPSVHLDRRLEGSVLLSPSTATSWGPESLLNSPMSTLFRLPSPDIGQRVTEDCPPTPSAATSWGPEDLLCSPADVKCRLPSPSLGQRVSEDCPPTPPTLSFRGPEEQPHSHNSLNFSMPLPGLWPYSPSMLETLDSSAAKNGMSGTSGIAELHPTSHVFPYFSASSRPTWTFVWPFHKSETVFKATPSQFSFTRRSYVTEESATSNGFGPFAPHPVTSLHMSDYLSLGGHCNHICGVQSRLEAISVRLESSYPTLVIYPLVYPYLSVYLPLPTDLAIKQEVKTSIMHDSRNHLELGIQYPYFDLYPAGYPTNLMYIYPLSPQPRSATSLPNCLSPSYPSVIPYHPKTVTPCSEVDQTDSDTHLYPPFEVYPAVAEPSKVKGVYPRITLYPAVYPELDPYPPVFVEETGSILKTELTQRYPRIQNYPAVYPWFEIYPGHVSVGEADVATYRVASLQPFYPQSEIFYSCLDIYRTGSHRDANQQASLSVMLPIHYPTLSLYPPTYPHFEIFPPVTQPHLDLASKQSTTPFSEWISDSVNGPTGEAVSLASVPFSRKVKTHKELHEEVFGAGAPVKESVEQEPLGDTPVRGRTRSISANALPALSQTAPSPPSSLDPVHPLPMPEQPLPRRPSHNADARHGVLSTHPYEARSLPTDRPSSPHVTLNTHSSPTPHVVSIARPSSHRSANSSDHGHPKQSHRPRDSLVLEKARYFDHFHALPSDDHASSERPARLAVPPVPQLPFDIPHPQKLDHTKYSIA